MDLKTLLEPCKVLKILEEREMNQDQINVVINTQDSAKWSAGLEQSLGPALKPAGESPSNLAKKAANEFGGIRKEQTLFVKNIDEYSVVAMFWPWQNDKHTTLKIFKTPQIDLTEKKNKFLFF